MALNKKLKAFVRFDGSGRVVAGSLILRKKQPKVGRWNEISAYECCGPVIPPTVTDLVVDTFDATTIDVSWTASVVANNQAVVTHYILYLDTVQVAIVAAADTLAYVYLSLTTATSYDLTYGAVTADGETVSAIVTQVTA